MNPYINVIIISLMPIAECRGAIPYGIVSGMDVTTVAILSFLGNILPVPFILLLMNKLEAMILRYDNLLKKIYVKYINNLRKRSSNVVERYGFYGLIIFIALPLPGTGAWTGSIVAHIFGIKLIKALFAILVGVAIAVVIVTVTTVIIL